MHWNAAINVLIVAGGRTPPLSENLEALKLLREAVFKKGAFQPPLWGIPVPTVEISQEDQVVKN